MYMLPLRPFDFAAVAVAGVLLGAAVQAAAPSDRALPRSPIPARDLGRLDKEVKAYYAALDADDRARQFSSVDALEKAYARVMGRHKVDRPLAMLGDWELVLQQSKTEIRELRAAPGKGFQRYVFQDPEDGTRVVTLVSLPAGYGKGDQLFPVIIGLKQHMALSGAELEKAALEACATAYQGLLDKAIVFVPLGRETGTGRSAAVQEPEGSWMVIDNLITMMFGSLRLLCSSIAYDRAAVILDGWKDAGLQAMEVAAAFPATFAGVVIRSGPVSSTDIPWANLARTPVLYVDGQADGVDVDSSAFAARTDLMVSRLEDRTSALALSESVAKELADWILQQRRDLAPAEISHGFTSESFNQCGWIRADEIARRPTVRPGDADFPRLTARADRESNTIHLTTVSIRAVRIFLSDALVDLDRPVTVIVNGEDRGSRSYPRSLRYLLENRYLNASGDDGLYVAEILVPEIPLNIPAAPVGG